MRTRLLPAALLSILLCAGCGGSGGSPTGPSGGGSLAGTWAIAGATLNGAHDPTWDGHSLYFGTDQKLLFCSPSLSAPNEPNIDELTWSFSGRALTLTYLPPSSGSFALQVDLAGSTLTLTSNDGGLSITTWTKIAAPADVRLVDGWEMYKALQDGQPDPSGHNWGREPWLLYMFADGKGQAGMSPGFSAQNFAWSIVNGRLVYDIDQGITRPYRFDQGDLVIGSDNGPALIEEYFRHR